MIPFHTLTSRAIPLPAADIDTDAILPARFLLLLSREGLGEHLFHELRRNAQFALNRPDLAGAQIIVGGPRFGIGSSREQAVWALADYGIRCIIAPSFGEIFYANCINNGILPITLEGEPYEGVLDAADASVEFHIDLTAQTIDIGKRSPITFGIDASRRDALLSGRDTLDTILHDDMEHIARFEAQQQDAEPWLWIDETQFAPFASIGGDND